VAGTITWEQLRELAAFRATRGYAVSLYLDLDPSVVRAATALRGWSLRRAAAR